VHVPGESDKLHPLGHAPHEAARRRASARCSRAKALASRGRRRLYG
jgi:hypothetical protein